MIAFCAWHASDCINKSGGLEVEGDIKSMPVLFIVASSHQLCNMHRYTHPGLLQVTIVYDMLHWCEATHDMPLLQAVLDLLIAWQQHFAPQVQWWSAWPLDATPFMSLPKCLQKNALSSRCA